MTKRLKLIYVLLMAVNLTLLTACYNDDAINEGGTTLEDGKVTVRFRVSQAAPTTTRASWQDNNATDAEMMNVWTVVAVEHTTNQVIGIWSCQPIVDSEKEIDDIEEIVVNLDKGKKYRFYSFANMAAADLGTILGLSGKIPTPTDKGEIVPATADLADCTLAESTVENIAVNVKGNGFDPNADNGFGVKGIPMSNVQTFNSLNDGDIKDLIVIRMLAKIKLQIYNDSDEDITIKSVTLTSLTANPKEGNAGYKNLMLLPKLSKGQDTMESSGQYHGDIKPNLNGTPEQEEYTYTPSSDKNNTLASGKPVEYVFYVNESENPKGENWGVNGGTAQEFNRYFLKIVIDKGNDEEELRYTLIDDSNADKGSDKWDYIARNDYRIIPIVLDDYRLDLIPYDFPAIGVYPASVKEEDGIYTINFHDYGHFHLLPVVTKYSDESEKLQDKEKVPYGEPSQTDDDKTFWTLNGGTFNSAWGTWADAKKTPYEGNFYKTSNDTKDADDAGGAPIWYKNDGTDGPQWSPDGEEPYLPFIFGYIADPKGEVKPDRKVYHEFSILLHKPGSESRQMTYRLYMILDEDQMLYRSRSKATPRCPHHWH